jgi:hypothetical protein
VVVAGLVARPGARRRQHRPMPDDHRDSVRSPTSNSSRPRSGRWAGRSPSSTRPAFR